MKGAGQGYPRAGSGTLCVARRISSSKPRLCCSMQLSIPPINPQLLPHSPSGGRSGMGSLSMKPRTGRSRLGCSAGAAGTAFCASTALLCKHRASVRDALVKRRASISCQTTARRHTHGEGASLSSGAAASGNARSVLFKI